MIVHYSNIYNVLVFKNLESKSTCKISPLVSPTICRCPEASTGNVRCRILNSAPCGIPSLSMNELGLLVVQLERLKDQKKGLMQKLLSGDIHLTSMEAAE